ncbi:site-specific integrase [Roseomonas sp. NAR14]|uniref:Site-specific integrase n=1 Tax=Roseomonas acroporae TaxID=2937791 RepID=A0A9X2BUZ1_9PROT|nr:site-specific integrase [Roseomonas acroporae]MCK8786118.1 site-specific integrase [Roseomonas acroporae]
MPLGKPFRRSPNGPFYVRGTVRGQSVFESTGTTDPERAEAYRVRRENEIWDRAIHGARAVVTFAEAVESYLKEEERRPDTKRLVARLLDHFGLMQLGTVNQEALDRAYPILLTSKAGPATRLRAVLTPLRAIMEHAAIRGWCARPAFKTPKVAKVPTIYLRPSEVAALIVNAAPHLRPLLVFLAGTGCRMSEALELEWSSVDLRGSRATVWQKQGNERDVDLAPVVVAALSGLPHREGPVFRPGGRRTTTGLGRGKTKGKSPSLAYRSTGRAGGNQIRSGWRTACRKAGLPGHWHVWTPAGAKETKRQWVADISPHDLRHTWASWDYCLHSDLLGLRDRGGWSTITMVTRYAKKMPAAYRKEIIAFLNGRAQGVQAALRDVELVVSKTKDRKS